MTREWQPGDAAVRSYLGIERRSLFVKCGMKQHDLGGSLHWHHFDGGWDPTGEDREATYRPLVVIDPEDRQQVARMSEAFCLDRWDHTGTGDECDPLTFASMQAALREFADPKPPKPDEPTGLGAVVEDASGGKWVRLVRSGEDSTRDDWKRSGYRGCDDTWHFWSDIDAVKVLSEGVAP